MRRVAVVALLCVLGACGSTATRADASSGQTILFVGDSLAVEAQTMLSAKLPGTIIVPATAPGIPICQIRANLDRLIRTNPAPAVIVIESFGNYGLDGGCMTPAELVAGSPAYYQRYATDLHAMTVEARATGARVVYEMPPEDRWLPEVRHELMILAVIESARSGLNLGWGGRNQVGGDRWRHDLPCLTTEGAVQGCVAGRIVVRSPDLIHFCPVLYPGLADYAKGCPVYASGIVRYGRGIAADVRGLVNT